MSLYHGSNFKIEKYLEPIESKILDGDKAIFASYYRYLILAFLGKKWSNKDLELGSYKFKTYLVEKRPNAFEDIYKGQKGYMYEVSKSGFKKDERICNKVERIKTTKSKIKNTYEIKDLLEELIKSDILMIKYSDLNFVYFTNPKNKKLKLKIIKNKFNFDNLKKLEEGNYLVQTIEPIDYIDIRKNLYGELNKKIKKIGFCNINTDRFYFIFD